VGLAAWDVSIIARCSFTSASASDVAKAWRKLWKSTRFDAGVSLWMAWSRMPIRQS